MTKNCVNCGNPFESCRDSNIFCSKKCNNNSRSKKVIKEISEEIAGEENIFQESKEREIKTNDVLHNVPDDIAGWKTRAFSTNKDGEVVTTWRRKQEEGFVLTDEVKQFIQEGFSDIKPFTFIVNNKPKSVKTQIINIGDLHVGMKNEENQQFGETWNLEKAEKRVLSLVNHIVDCEELIILLLGDNNDGWNGFTTSMSHKLPQNLNNREQIFGLFQIYQKLFTIISDFQVKGIINKVRCISVGESNHSGDHDFIIASFLSEWLKAKYPLMETYVAKKYIDIFESGGKNFFFCHGKNQNTQKHGFPLFLDDKTLIHFTSVINSFDKKADEDTWVICADKHQYLSQFKLFNWHRVGSMASGSDWQHANFANNSSSTTYLKVLDTGIVEQAIIHFKN